MLPVVMNEFIQRNLAEVGVEMEIDVIEWNTYTQRIRKGFVEENAEYNAFNQSWTSVSPSVFVKWFHSDYAPPTGFNRMGYSSTEVDDLLNRAQLATDVAERDQLLREANVLIMDDAPWLFLVHDLNPRVLSPKVKGYVQEMHSYTSILGVWVE
jgi:peptide/nickel transport system substrate-binding protein